MRISKGQVEHDARKRLVRALFRNGPLTAGDLSDQTGLSIPCVRHHLRVLRPSGVVAAVEETWTGSGEPVYATRCGDLPRWASEALLGEFTLCSCLRLLHHLVAGGPLRFEELSRRAELSPEATSRYLRSLGSWGMVESDSTETDEGGEKE